MVPVRGTPAGTLINPRRVAWARALTRRRATRRNPRRRWRKNARKRRKRRPRRVV